MWVGANTMVSIGRQAYRAREFDAGQSSPVINLSTLWLPPLVLDPDTIVHTYYGDKSAWQVCQGDFVRFPFMRMPDDFSPEEYVFENDTTGAYIALKKLWETRHSGATLIDMMDSPEHVQHWRTDTWMLSPREFSAWYSRYLIPERDEWWMMVFEPEQGFDTLVEIGRTDVELYGIAL